MVYNDSEFTSNVGFLMKAKFVQIYQSTDNLVSLFLSTRNHCKAIISKSANLVSASGILVSYIAEHNDKTPVANQVLYSDLLSHYFQVIPKNPVNSNTMTPAILVYLTINFRISICRKMKHNILFSILGVQYCQVLRFSNYIIHR